MRVPNYTRQELCNVVYTAVSSASEALTRLEIARSIGRGKSPHVVRMIEELAAGGWLIKHLGKDKFGRPTWMYSVGRPIGNHCDTTA